MQEYIITNPFDHKGQWIEDPKEAETLRNFMKEIFKLEIPENYNQIGITKKGKIKYTIKGSPTILTLTLESVQNLAETAKKKYIEYKLGALRDSTKNFFDFIKYKQNFIENAIRNILFHRATIKIQWNTYLANIYDEKTGSNNIIINFATQNNIAQNEGKNDHEIKEWLFNFLEKTLKNFREQLKEKIIQEAKTNIIREKTIDAIPELKKGISVKYNCDTQISTKENKQNFKITLTIKPYNSNLTFKRSQTFNKEELSELGKYITVTVSEEFTPYSYKLSENFNQTITKFIENKILQGTIIINSNQTPQNTLPEKLGKRYEKYEETDKSLPEWFIKKPANKFQIILFLENNTITYYTKYFQASGTKTKEFQETKYGKKITEFHKNSILKEALKFVKKLNLQFSKENLLVNGEDRKEYGEITSNYSITKNNINKIYTMQVTLTDNTENWKQVLQININNILIKINKELEKKEKEIIPFTKNLLNIAVAKTIYNNDDCEITDIISNLRGINTIQYHEMNKSEFTNTLNLIPTAEIEIAIHFLTRKGIITTERQGGTYQWYTAYYSNPLTETLVEYYEKNKKQIFKENNIVLEKHIQLIKKKKHSELSIKDYMPLIDENNKIIDYAMNLEALKEVFRYAPDDIIKLMSMKKKLITDPVLIKVYNALIKAQKDYKKLLKEAAKNPERFEIQEEQ